MIPAISPDARMSTRYTLKFLREDESLEALFFSVTFPVLNTGPERWEAILFLRLPAGSHGQGGSDAMQKAAAEFAGEHGLDAPRFFRDVLACFSEALGLSVSTAKSPVFGRMDEEAMQ